MSELAARGVNELHVEAGEQLNGSLLKAGLVDELLVYLAPKLLGPGRSLAAFGPLANLADAPAFEFLECTPIGPDLRLRARPPGRAGFWDWA
jgi:diaminohydroxyphosphoribosylaminopyrimidine deaminase/5-amino-6-(5-phosphoribosylamino)uracil reductase